MSKRNSNIAFVAALFAAALALLAFHLNDQRSYYKVSQEEGARIEAWEVARSAQYQKEREESAARVAAHWGRIYSYHAAIGIYSTQGGNRRTLLGIAETLPNADVQVTVQAGR